MVDLDAAKDGSHANYGVVEQVIRETGATVELGGGIRSMQDVETVLALGVSRVIIGSAAVRDPEFVAEAVKKYGDKIVVGIDAKSETVRTDGWLDDSGENYIAFAERMESYGVKNIIFTDIDKDGMLAGPNFDQLAALRASVSCEIIASGGVSTLEDIAALKKLGIDGAIAGKAVYTGTLDLAKAIKEAEVMTLAETHYPLSGRQGRPRGQGRELCRTARRRRPGRACEVLLAGGRGRDRISRHHRDERQPRHDR